MRCLTVLALGALQTIGAATCVGILVASGALPPREAPQTFRQFRYG